MIHTELVGILKEEGLEPIHCVGETFDPTLHEAVLVETSDREEDEILEELQKGYKFKNKVIRHSKVKIAKN